MFVKRTSNQQWQAKWSYCLLVKHIYDKKQIYNESKLISVEVSLTDIQEGKDKKGRVRTKVIEERYFESWLMTVNFETVLVKKESTTTPATTLDATDNVDDDQTDMATRGSESNQVHEDRPPRMIFQGNKEDVNSSIYSSSSSSSSSGGASSSNEFYSVISSTESFSSSSMYSSCSSDTNSSYYVGHGIPGRYLDFNSPIPLPKDDDDASSTSARSSCCSSGASDQVLIASKSARLLKELVSR